MGSGIEPPTPCLGKILYSLQSLTFMLKARSRKRRDAEAKPLIFHSGSYLKAYISKLEKARLELIQLCVLQGQRGREALRSLRDGGSGADREMLDQNQPHQLAQKRCVLHHAQRCAPDLDSLHTMHIGVHSLQEGF